jgi:hypothetical protein
MTHLPAQLLADRFAPIEIATMATTHCQPVLAVVTDKPEVASVFDNICDFLGFGIEILSTDINLRPLLARCQPMAVVAELDGAGQDGCHVMMQVADHDATLPLLILTGDEPGMAGAVDAIEELWHLTCVTQARHLPAIGDLVEFLFHAGRRGNCVRMMPV